LEEDQALQREEEEMKAEKEIYTKKLVFIEQKLRFFEEELKDDAEHEFLTEGEKEYFENAVAELSELYTSEQANYEEIDKKVSDLNFKNFSRRTARINRVIDANANWIENEYPQLKAQYDKEIAEISNTLSLIQNGTV
jgi:deoxyribodipyrimidine photolyase-like uncharacterized protein